MEENRIPASYYPVLWGLMSSKTFFCKPPSCSPLTCYSRLTPEINEAFFHTENHRSPDSVSCRGSPLAKAWRWLRRADNPRLLLTPVPFLQPFCFLLWTSTRCLQHSWVATMWLADQIFSRHCAKIRHNSKTGCLCFYSHLKHLHIYHHANLLMLRIISSGPVG